MNTAPLPVTPTLVRCAVYTRKSTEEGLDQDFNTLDAQREAAEAFIKSQAREGWVCLPQRYDDGGFSGGTIERPALQRLLADIQAGAIDCLLVYKIDRLSRSLLDFARLMATFEQHRVSFVSVTQQFSTTTSMGRLTLNILLSFAQFEREIIAERTRDKMAAARRKGKWAGGIPVLGYDVDARAKRLVVNPDEAERVRAIFALYLVQGALLPVVQELDRRGWRTKTWVTRKGRTRGGRAFTKTRLHELLTNVVYRGQVRYRGELFAGEQAALVDGDIWRQVQEVLRENSKATRQQVRLRSDAVLAGLLRCRPCGCAMTPARVSKRGGRSYAYYVCTVAQKRGWHTCPSKSLPAAAIERYVLEQLRELAGDAGSPSTADGSAAIGVAPAGHLDWDVLSASERVRLIRERVERVEYDGTTGTVALTIRVVEEAPHSEDVTSGEGG